MLAAREVGIVADEHVAGRDPSWVLADQVPHGVVEAAEVHRRRQPLRQVRAGGITERRREIHRIPHDRRVRRLHEDQGHLVRNRLERVAQHLEQNRIRALSHASALRKRDDDVVVRVERRAAHEAARRWCPRIPR